MNSNKHNFRLSTLMSALALCASAPAFAHGTSTDASFADSMAVGGDTSSTYQQFDSKPQAQPVVAQQPAQQPPGAEMAPPAEVATAQPDTAGVPADTSTPLVAAATTPMSAATSTDTVASSDAPAAQPDEVLLLLVAEQPSPSDTIAAGPAATALPVAALEPQIITREQVRDELRIARQAGTVSRTGELADTPEVLLAREEFNVAQADAIVAEYRAEQDRQLAMAAAESRRAQIEAEGAELAALAAWSPMADQPGDVRLEIIDMSGE